MYCRNGGAGVGVKGDEQICFMAISERKSVGQWKERGYVGVYKVYIKLLGVLQVSLRFHLLMFKS